MSTITLDHIISCLVEANEELVAAVYGEMYGCDAQLDEEGNVVCE